MRSIRAFFIRLGGLFGKGRWERELEQELESHLQLHTEENLRAGMGPREARRAAVMKLGGVEAVKESYRDRKGLPALEGLLKDLRYAARTLGRSPAFAVTAVVTLALGIGANTAVFTVVRAVLLRPLPYPDPERLIAIHDGMSQADQPGWPACVADFLVWQGRAHSFQQLAAFAPNGFTLTGGGEAEQVLGASVTAQFFELLGARPLMGRTFAAGEDQPGHTATAVISERLWQRRYRGDAGIVGKTIVVNGAPVMVIGVMPAGFHYSMREADLWRILTLNPPTRRGPFFLRGLARLKQGVTLQQVNTELDALGREVEAADPKNVEHARYPVMPVLEGMVSDIRPLLGVLTGAVGLVLLIAIFNVANLMLARASTRQREMAIRLSIGAGRGQLVRQLLIESVVLALAGGAGGVLLAALGVRALRAVAPPGLPRLEEIVVDQAVLWFTVLVSIASGLLFGLAPVLGAPLASLNAALKEGGRGSADAPRSRRLRGALVVMEVSLSVMLLAGAGLLIRSFDLLGRVAIGFQAAPGRILTLNVMPASQKYRDPNQLRRYWDELAARVRQLPGVEAAAVSITIPPDRTAFTDAYEIPGRTPRDGPQPVAVPFVSQDYFRALGIPLLRGRTFDNRDTADSPPVTVISETMARRYFGSENPVGQRLKHGGPTLNNPYMEIIGVVGDVKYEGPGEASEPVYYESNARNPSRPMWLVVRTRTDASALLASVRAEVRAMDPDVPVAHAGTMADAMEESVALPRFRSTLMAIFASTALLLAAVGIYGVIAYSVVQRTHEMGIRMALGASQGRVLRLVLGQGSRLALIGIGIGLVGAAMFVRVLKTMLFGVSPTDPVTFATVTVVLGAAALLASFIPAQRAARVSPVQALRQE